MSAPAIRAAITAAAKPLGRGIGSVLSTIFNKHAIAGIAKFGAYSAASWGLSEYANGNFEHQGSKNVAAFGSLMLQAKGAHSLLMGGTRTLGLASARAGAALGNRSLMNFGAELSPAGKVAHTFGVRAGAGVPNVRRFGTRMLKTAAGGTDNFMSSLAPEKLLWGGAKMAGSGLMGLASLPVSAVRGTGEYIGLGFRANRAMNAAKGLGRAAQYGAGWSTLGVGMASMEHPLAPMIAGGALLGGAHAAASRLHRNANGEWGESLYSRPLTNDTWGEHAGAVGSVDPSNFPAGIAIGRGRSAITSQSVMTGQGAVTSKMLRMRRV